MKKSFQTLGGISAIAVLSACSGTTSLPIPQANAARVQAGEEVTAKFNASAQLHYGDDTTAPTSGASFKLRRESDGTYVATINGMEHQFTDADRVAESDGTVYTFQRHRPDEDFYTNLWSANGTLDEAVVNSGSYARVMGMQINTLDPTDGGDNHRAYAVLGDLTPDMDVTMGATVTYGGYARVDQWPSTGFEDQGSSRTRYDGDLNLTADFAAGTVSGLIDNLAIREPGADRVGSDMLVIMGETAINGNTFMGDISLNGSDLVADGETVGNYEGGFFGPAAEEAAGVMTFDIEDSTAIGHFSGSQ